MKSPHTNPETKHKCKPQKIQKKKPVQASKEKRNKLQRDKMTRSEHPPRKLTIIRKE
jgi:hypothetical protein